MRFVNATSDDLPQILELLRLAALRLKNKGVDQWSYWLNPPEERLNWVTQGVYAGEFTLVYKEDQLAAMYRLMKEDLLYWGKQEKPAYYIHSLVTHPDFTGQKLGFIILNHITQLALNDRISLLRLDCKANNPELCNYYLNQGFQKVGEVTMPHSVNALFEKEIG